MKKIYQIKSIDLAFLKSNPPSVAINAAGLAPTTGWGNGQLIPYVYIAPPADGIWDFDFVGDPPQLGGDALSPIEANYVWQGNTAMFKGVRVHASSNDLVTVLGDRQGVREMSVVSARGGDQPLPLGNGDPWPR